EGSRWCTRSRQRNLRDGDDQRFRLAVMTAGTTSMPMYLGIESARGAAQLKSPQGASRRTTTRSLRSNAMRSGRKAATGWRVEPGPDADSHSPHDLALWMAEKTRRISRTFFGRGGKNRTAILTLNRI